MRLDSFWLIHGPARLLRFSKASNEAFWFGLEASVNSSACPGVNKLGKLFVIQIQEFFELDAAEGEFLEGAFLAQRCRAFHLSIIHVVSSDGLFSDSARRTLTLIKTARLTHSTK